MTDKSILCLHCGDYTIWRGEDISTRQCSCCDWFGFRHLSRQEMCDACNNPHKSNLVHTCQSLTKRELQEAVQPYTMASPERIDLLIELADRCNRENIPGDFVECGVCNGGSAAILAHFAQDVHGLHLFDSFEGLPATTEHDLPSFGTGHSAKAEVGKCVGSLERVIEVIQNVAPDAIVDIWPGWFHETFPDAAVHIKEIAMLNLDSDWYESEKLCLETWYEKVSPGGFIYFDDFYYWPGCQMAALEFFKTPPIFHRVGHSAWIQK